MVVVDGGALCEERGGRPRQRCFPPSVFPLWNPPFLIPPSKSNTPKGENRRGQQRGGFTGAAGETAGPLVPRGAAPRRPPGCQGHSAACPPCSSAPAGPGALVGPTRAALLAAPLPALHGRRRSSQSTGSRYSPESWLHRSPGSWLRTALPVAAVGVPPSATIAPQVVVPTGLAG